jgi:hypothetical protein
MFTSAPRRSSRISIGCGAPRVRSVSTHDPSTWPPIRGMDRVRGHGSLPGPIAAGEAGQVEPRRSEPPPFVHAGRVDVARQDSDHLIVDAEPRELGVDGVEKRRADPGPATLGGLATGSASSNRFPCCPLGRAENVTEPTTFPLSRARNRNVHSLRKSSTPKAAGATGCRPPSRERSRTDPGPDDRPPSCAAMLRAFLHGSRWIAKPVGPDAEVKFDEPRPGRATTSVLSSNERYRVAFEPHRGGRW